MYSEPANILALVLPNFVRNSFDISSDNRTIDYFPDFLKNRLNNWISNYVNTLQPILDENVPFADGRKDATISKCKQLIQDINATVDLYFKGKILEATQLFNSSMDSIFKGIQKTSILFKERQFFRSRLNSTHKFLTRNELFHIPFELRHLVSTNRYSIPGLPALYLGDLTYVCWEEGNRAKVRDIYFSRFSNTRELNIIEITRFDDILKEILEEKNDLLKIATILRYVVTFPLTLACTCKVKEQAGFFKAEYIIPQLLIQYVSKQNDIDGIKFPSSKIDYSKLKELPAYNYVFPVKIIDVKGYCPVLKDSFVLTEPTSLELEEVLYNPLHSQGVVFGSSSSLQASLELIPGVTSYYVNTSFGKIEQILRNRPVSRIN